MDIKEARKATQKQLGYYEDVAATDTATYKYYKFIDSLLFKVEDGLMIELPCKVGDTVYCLCWGKPETCDTRSCPVKIDDIAQCGMCDDGVYGAHEIPFEIGWYDELGKTVFLTREAAEAALKESASATVAAAPKENQ